MTRSPLLPIRPSTTALRIARTLAGIVVVLALVGAFPAVASAAPGQVDATFGHLGNGTVWSDSGPGDYIHKVLRQTDGKIVTVAQVINNNLIGVIVVTRYLANGSLDTGFGTGGHFAKESPLSGEVTDAALQPDGKIVLVGTTETITSPTSRATFRFFVMRLLANGKVDPSFVAARANFGARGADEATGVALGPGGTIVVAGLSDEHLAIARYTSTGALDTTFSGDGLVTEPFGGEALASDVAVQGDGRIVVAGVATTVTLGQVQMLLARFDTNGTLDPTYGTGGRATTTGAPIADARNLLLQGNKAIIAGASSTGVRTLARYNANGTLDTTFGSGGKAIIRSGAVTVTSDLVSDGSGRLVVVGEAALADDEPAVPTLTALFRYSANGIPDATFGCNGTVLTEMLGNGSGTTYDASSATSVAVTGNELLVAGIGEVISNNSPASDDFVARYDGDGPHTAGYTLLRGDSGTSSFGGAAPCGSMSGFPFNSPIVGGAADPVAPGNWTVAADGGVFSFGAAGFFGSTGAIHLNQPIVGMAAAPDGKGYWLVARDGGVFAFGSARFYGSTGAVHLNQPIVGMAAARDGKGYWLVARDGGVFAFGSAKFKGSTGSLQLNKPIVGMAADPDGTGYWLVGSDGGIFAFSATFSGSTGAIKLNQPIVGIAADPDGTGYWLAARDGGVFAFSATFEGSTGTTPFPIGSAQSTIGIAATP